MTTLNIIAIVLTMGSLAITIGVALAVFYKSKSYVQLIVASWVGLFIWSIINCLLFPIFLHRLGYADAFKHFPEGPGIVACAFTGWMLGIFLAVIIYVFRLLAKVYKEYS